MTLDLVGTWTQLKLYECKCPASDGSVEVEAVLCRTEDIDTQWGEDSEHGGGSDTSDTYTVIIHTLTECNCKGQVVGITNGMTNDGLVYQMAKHSNVRSH